MLLQILEDWAGTQSRAWLNRHLLRYHLNVVRLLLVTRGLYWHHLPRIRLLYSGFLRRPDRAWYLNVLHMKSSSLISFGRFVGVFKRVSLKWNVLSKTNMHTSRPRWRKSLHSGWKRCNASSDNRWFPRTFWEPVWKSRKKHMWRDGILMQKMTLWWHRLSH